MTTLAANANRAIQLGDIDHAPVIASDIIYGGAAVGIVKASGHARPLVAGDRFAGFAKAKADNSSGAAAAINVELSKKGQIELTVTGVLITDRDQPVYASDDDTFTMLPASGTTSNSFIGHVKRFVSTGVAIVEYNAETMIDPYGYGPREVLSANKTLDAEDNGKTFFVDTDAFTITLPATTTGLDCTVVNAKGYGQAAINLSPQAADLILGPDITAADNKDLINTKATAQRGDFVGIADGDADGYVVYKIKGVWAREA